jgi:hypothetical protein
MIFERSAADITRELSIVIKGPVIKRILPSTRSSSEEDGKASLATSTITSLTPTTAGAFDGHQTRPISQQDRGAHGLSAAPGASPASVISEVAPCG